MKLAPQTNYFTAIARGVEHARSRHPEIFSFLGATPQADGCVSLPVLDAVFSVDLNTACVTRASENQDMASPQKVGVAWQILALHYLGAKVPFYEPLGWISFADLPDGRGYENVYRARVIRRLCGTAGRNRSAFASACQRLGGQRVVWGDEGFRFEVFPRLPVIVAWYDGDGELPPNASFVYPDTVLSMLPVEDVVVLSEGLVGRLQGKDW